MILIVSLFCAPTLNKNPLEHPTHAHNQFLK